jgi:hypothetical protein
MIVDCVLLVQKTEGGISAIVYFVKIIYWMSRVAKKKK